MVVKASKKHRCGVVEMFPIGHKYTYGNAVHSLNSFSDGRAKESIGFVNEKFIFTGLL